MGINSKTLLALAAAVIAVPANAAAQQAYAPPQGAPSYGPAPYASPPADQAGETPAGPGGVEQGHRAQLGVYPQFHAMEKQIRHAVREARRSNALAPRAAHGMMAQLRQIEAEEMQIYQTHGMNLPSADQARLQSEFSQLAQAVDQTRAQQQ